MKATLNETELADLLQSHPEWKLQNGKLVREWAFKDFVEAMAFVNRVAATAEAVGHHPDIDIRFNQVTLTLTTHDEGGITEKDVSLARQCDEAFSTL